MPSQRPQTEQASRSASCASNGCGLFLSAGVSSKRSKARTMRRLHLSVERAEWRFAASTAVKASQTASLVGMFTSPVLEEDKTTDNCPQHFSIGNRRFRALATVARAGRFPHPAGRRASFHSNQVGSSPGLCADDAGTPHLPGEYVQRSAAAFLYASSRPHNTAPGLISSGHPSAAEMPTQMVSQAVRDQRCTTTAHASEARDQFTTNSGEPFTSPRRVSSVKATQDQTKGLVSVGLRQIGQILPVFSSNRKRSEFAPTRPANTPDRLTEQVIGGFHGSRFRPSTPSLGAL